MICSQDDPHSHKTPQEIERETGISQTTVRRIVKQDLQLKTYTRVIGQVINEGCHLKRLQRGQPLMEMFPNEKYTKHLVRR